MSFVLLFILYSIFGFFEIKRTSCVLEKSLWMPPFWQICTYITCCSVCKNAGAESAAIPHWYIQCYQVPIRFPCLGNTILPYIKRVKIWYPEFYNRLQKIEIEFLFFTYNMQGEESQFACNIVRILFGNPRESRN